MSTVITEAATDLFVEHALRIGRERLAEARELEDGSLSWHPGYGVEFQPVPDSGIFNGRVGEALFLAALHAATGDAEMRAAALRAVGPLRARCAAPGGPQGLLAEVGYGLTGVGSMVYALVRMAGFLDEPALLDDARALAAVLTPDAITLDRKYEVFWGTAGAALGLLALAGAEHDGGRWVDAAALCAAHLVESRVTDAETGLRSWPTSGDVPNTGFAHGSSGIAHALLEVHRRTGEERFRAAALETFAWERTLFREHLMDWPDNRDQPDERVMSSWCHGATGVGLSRLAVLDSMRPEEEEELVSDLFLAIKRTRQRLLFGTDNLCCGTFGRMDFLLEAGIRLGNPAPRDQALAAARRRLGDAGGLRRVVYDTGEHMDTGLWQGISGAGYQLLRLADPERFPSILLLA
ncbi:MAG TPA: lanthionine synthetase LanC family protein [Longimicrobium sp.]|jgi:lantibiotic modifying enzyme